MKNFHSKLLLLSSIIFVLSCTATKHKKDSLIDFKNVEVPYNVTPKEAIQSVPKEPELTSNRPKQSETSQKSDSTDLNIDQLLQAGSSYYQKKQYDKAIKYYKDVLVIAKKIGNEKLINMSSRIIALSFSNLAESYRSTGDYKKAEPLYKQALSIREKALGPDHPDTTMSLRNLAVLYRRMGDYGKAEPLYKRELSIKEKVLWSSSS